MKATRLLRGSLLGAKVAELPHIRQSAGWEKYKNTPGKALRHGDHKFAISRDGAAAVAYICLGGYTSGLGEDRSQATDPRRFR